LVNLQIAFPNESEKWHLQALRRSFQQLGDLAVEVSRLGGLTSEDVKSRVHYDVGSGIENYLQVKRTGSSVLFATAHLSAWELLPAAHALHGYPLSFVVRPIDNALLEKWVASIRCQFGNQTLPKPTALRQTVKLLREGADVGFLMDQNVQERDGVYAPLFGQPACTSSALAKLSLKTGIPIVAGFIYPKEKKGEYGIRFYPPIYPVPSDNHEEDVIGLTTRVNGHIEEMVREHPGNWLWGHRRFRTQPDGNDLYQ
jgi:KDO2-lipid IV(A) lauroyltransferase